MSSWIDRRRAGILLHVTSLSGPFACGVLGREARDFVDAMASGGFGVWQFLPLGPTHAHGSPYESQSSFAGNPRLLDLRDCVERGWLSKEACDAVMHGRLDRDAALHMAAAAFWVEAQQDKALHDDIRAFCTEQATWLNDYALFATIKTIRSGEPWWLWPAPLRHRKPAALKVLENTHAEHIRHIEFEQFLFARQWQRLKRHAERRGVLLFGDLPIYAAHDSADVWANQQYFTVNDAGLCEEVAGVPPDYFSETGQRWGNPLYRWDILMSDDFGWWIDRIQAQLARMHLLRIDHFRGLEAYWAIPGEQQDGRIGEWRPAPGDALLTCMEQRLGRLPLVAEDLGMITPEVHALRKRFGLPGMKVLQFAFDGDPDNPYLPAHHEPDSVVYTGTHDNDTTLGWFQGLDEATRACLGSYIGTSCDDMPWPLVEMALASPSLLAVIPMQDILALDGTHRLNTPGTLDGNWSWRMRSMPEAARWQRALALIRKHHRQIEAAPS